MPIYKAKSNLVQKVALLRGHNDGINAVAWTPDSKWVASAAKDGSLYLWSIIDKTGDIKPRVRLIEQSNTPIGRLSWDGRGLNLACGKTDGSFEIWVRQNFNPIIRSSAQSISQTSNAIRSIQWAPLPEELPLTLQITLGKKIHFYKYTSIDSPLKEIGSHNSDINCSAWTHDGKMAFTGTADGMIGIWNPFDEPHEKLSNNNLPQKMKAMPSWEHEYGFRGSMTSEGTILRELRDVLSDNRKVKAHEAAIVSIACATKLPAIVSGDSDQVIKVWNTEDRSRRLSLKIDEQILNIRWVHNDTLIAVQTINQIIFIESHTGAIKYHHDTAGPSLTNNDKYRSAFEVSNSCLLASIEDSDDSAVHIFRIDFDSILALKNTKSIPLQAAGISIVGNKGSGKTSLATALRESFADVVITNTSTHNINRCRVDNSVQTGNYSTRELILWDAPDAVEQNSMHRLHGTNCSIEILTLKPVSFRRLLAEQNTTEWSHAVQRKPSKANKKYQKTIYTITHCDKFSESISAQQVEKLRGQIGCSEIYAISTRSKFGIDELKRGIESAINWTLIEPTPSAELIELVLGFINDLLGGNRRIFRLSEFIDRFVSIHPLEPGKDLSFEADLIATLHFLELAGNIYYFENSLSIIIDARTYYQYSSSMFIAAATDWMGRLPIDEIFDEEGSNFKIPDDIKLNAPSEHRQLIDLSIRELTDAGIAKSVSTDGKSHLVFPSTILTRREANDRILSRHSSCEVHGELSEVSEAYTALIVRLLALVEHYKVNNLWFNEASFTTATGNTCEIMLEDSPGDDKGNLHFSFSTNTNQEEVMQFRGMAIRHFEEYGIPHDDFKDEQIELPASTPFDTVYISHDDQKNPLSLKNAESISALLEKFGLRIIKSQSNRLGMTRTEQLDELRQTKVCLFLCSKRPTRDRLEEFRLLERAGCRMIPMLLANAPTKLPDIQEFSRWAICDQRGSALIEGELIESIKHALAYKNSVSKVARHVFMSYVRKDFERVKEIVEQIEAAGHRVWWDVEGISVGEMWESTIPKAIRESMAFVICLPHTAPARSFIHKELQIAAEVQALTSANSAFIIPVLVADGDKKKALSGYSIDLAQFHAIDLSSRNSNISPLIRKLNEIDNQTD